MRIFKISTVLMVAHLVAVSSVVGGCSGSQSMAEAGSSPAAGKIFPIGEDVADRILGVAISSEFPGSAISKVEFPNRGYRVTVRFFVDSHDIVAYMIRSKGIDSNGNVVPGYYFEVSNSGTMPITQGGRAFQLYHKLIADASAVSQPLPQARHPGV